MGTPGEIHRVRLIDMRAGGRGTVLEILGGGGLIRRLEALGVRPGVRIEKMTGSPFGGPVVVRIGQTRLAVGAGMAGKIIVEWKETGKS